MIQEKLTVLKNSQVIDDAAFNYSQDAIEYLKKRKLIEQGDEADVFITHLAMATARQQTDEVIASVDESIKKEIQQSEHYEKAVDVWNELKQLAPTQFRSGEEGYFLLHLVTMMQTNG